MRALFAIGAGDDKRFDRLLVIVEIQGPPSVLSCKQADPDPENDICQGLHERMLCILSL